MAKESKSSVTFPARARVVSAPIANLGRWLRECLYFVVDVPDDESEEPPRFARVVCRQIVKGNKRGEEAFHVEVPKKADDQWSEVAAREIYGKLQMEVESLGGLQRYALYAYHSHDFDNHTARFLMRIQGAQDEDEDGDMQTEGGDKAGMLSQAHRHTEAFARSMTSMVLGLTGTFQSTIARQGEIIDRLLEDKLANIDAIRDLMENKEEHEVKMVQAKAKAQGVQELVGKLGLLMPSVVNKLAGKPVFPVQESALIMMTKGLVNSLAADPSKMQQLAGLLDAEQAVAFMNLVEEFSSKKDITEGAIVTTKGDDKREG